MTRGYVFLQLDVHMGLTRVHAEEIKVLQAGPPLQKNPWMESPFSSVMDPEYSTGGMTEPFTAITRVVSLHTGPGQILRFVCMMYSCKCCSDSETN